MRNMILMAAALTLSGASRAQTTTPTTSDPQGTTLPDPATNAPADAGTMQEMQNDPAVATPTQTDAAQPMQPTQQPMTTGTMPMQGSTMGNMAAMQPAAPAGTYPRCSRTVADRCTQIGPRR